MAELTGLTGRVALTMKVTMLKNFELSNKVDQFFMSKVVNFVFGDVSESEANVVCHDQKTVAPAASPGLALGSVGDNAFSDLTAMARARAIGIKNSSAVGVDCILEVGEAGVLGWGAGKVWKTDSDRNILLPGASMWVIGPPAGWVVGGGSEFLIVAENVGAEEGSLEYTTIGTT